MNLWKDNLTELEKFKKIPELIEYQIQEGKSFQDMIFSPDFQEKLLNFWKNYTMNSHKTRQSIKI